eukprot:scaffold5048_cov102-Isochrysis_galbana.AAC.5
MQSYEPPAPGCRRASTPQRQHPSPAASSSLSPRARAAEARQFGAAVPAAGSARGPSWTPGPAAATHGAAAPRAAAATGPATAAAVEAAAAPASWPAPESVHAPSERGPVPPPNERTGRHARRAALAAAAARMAASARRRWRTCWRQWPQQSAWQAHRARRRSAPAAPASKKPRPASLSSCLEAPRSRPRRTYGPVVSTGGECHAQGALVLPPGRLGATEAAARSTRHPL